MSDENGEPAADPAPGTGPELELGGDDLSGVSDPALASRLETIHKSMSTLGMRIDALVTSTTSYRSALTDRLTEYADLVTKLARSQAAELEEHRRTNEQGLHELRSGLAASEQTLERVGAKIDEALGDTDADRSREVLGEIRGILDAQESLGRFLTESLDQFGELVLGRLAAAEQANADRLESVRQALDAAVTTPTTSFESRLQSIDERLGSLAADDPAAALAGRFDTLHAALDDVTQELRARLAEVGGAAEVRGVADHLTKIESDIASTGKVADETWGELAGLRSKVDTILETSANESGAVTGVLAELKETMLDMASGEVVGSLWDEFRQLRATVEALVDHTGRTADPEAIEALRTEVVQLTGSVQTLLEAAEIVDEDFDDTGGLGNERLEAVVADIAALRRSVAELRALAEASVEPAPEGPAVPEELDARLRELRDGIDGVVARLEAAEASGEGAVEQVAGPSAEALDALHVEVTAMRDLLARGLEPSDAFGASVEQLRTELAGITEQLGVVTDLRRSISELRALAEESAETEPVASAVPEQLDAALRSLRTGIDDIVARLDQGLVLADEVELPGGDDTAAEVADQVATLRDLVRSEFDALRQLIDGTAAEPAPVDLAPVIARLDRLHDDIVDQQDAPEPVDLAPVTARLDRLHDDIAEQQEQQQATPEPVDLSPVLDAVGELRSSVAELAARPLPEPVAPAPDTSTDLVAQIDPDTIDLLREEIRSSARPADDLVESLRTELVALRRRIRLRAEGEVLSEEQLELIAAAVAERLAD